MLKFILKGKGTRTDKTIVRKTKFKDSLLYFKTYCENTVTKTVWHGQNNRYIDQLDIIERFKYS